MPPRPSWGYHDHGCARFVAPCPSVVVTAPGEVWVASDALSLWAHTDTGTLRAECGARHAAWGAGPQWGGARDAGRGVRRRGVRGAAGSRRWVRDRSAAGPRRWVRIPARSLGFSKGPELCMEDDLYRRLQARAGGYRNSCVYLWGVHCVAARIYTQPLRSIL